MSEPVQKRYIGDSVYAEDDGFSLVLTTENGYGPTNTIVLEPEIIAALGEYILAMTEARK